MSQRSLQTVKRHLQDSKVYQMAWRIKRVLSLRLKKPTKPAEKVIHLVPEKSPQGHVLLSFITEPFFLTPDQANMYGQHAHYWSVLEIAKIFLDMGYYVDVIRWNNNTFIPEHDYSIFIDFRLNLERIGHLLGKDCIKIMYIDTAHWLFHMTAQYNRLLALQQRKGITLFPYKTVAPNKGIEHADCAIIVGNAFTMSTYSYANKPLYRVPVVSPVVCPWPEEKDFEACRRNFLWFGSSGLVHKGLDLVLEAFVEMPEYHLTVCGPINQEKDFEQAYYRELYQTPNIHTIGWVKASSREFIDITDQCLGVVFASCSESGGGSVITCMHAGLIPIVSVESSVDVSDNFGMTLASCSIEEIKKSIRAISNTPSKTLKEMARQSWEFSRTYHTKEKYAEEFSKALEKITRQFNHQE